MNSEAVILERLAAIERQNQRIEALLTKLSGPYQPEVAAGNPYSVAKQLAREGKLAEAKAETRRVSALIAKRQKEEACQQQ